MRTVEEEQELIDLWRKHGLYREGDVTFDRFDHANRYVCAGDDFVVDEEVLSELDGSALRAEGTVQVDWLSVHQSLGDLGIFCVTDDVRCKDFFCMTESTGVGLGGDLVIDHNPFLGL